MIDAGFSARETVECNPIFYQNFSESDKILAGGRGQLLLGTHPEGTTLNLDYFEETGKFRPTLYNSGF